MILSAAIFTNEEKRATYSQFAALIRRLHCRAFLPFEAFCRAPTHLGGIPVSILDTQNLGVTSIAFGGHTKANGGFSGGTNVVSVVCVIPGV